MWRLRAVGNLDASIEVLEGEFQKCERVKAKVGKLAKMTDQVQAQPSLDSHGECPLEI